VLPIDPTGSGICISTVISIILKLVILATFKTKNLYKRSWMFFSGQIVERIIARIPKDMRFPDIDAANLSRIIDNPRIFSGIHSEAHAVLSSIAISLIE